MDEMPIGYSDKMVSVIEIKSWIAFATVLVILAATLAWGFFGTMRHMMEVTGVIVRSGRVFNIYATHDTVLLDFDLRPNQIVQRDQVIARLDRQDLVREINLMMDSGASILEIESRQAELIASSQIRTHESGRVKDVFARTGDFVRRGDRLATISAQVPGSRALTTFLFVSVDDAMSIRNGMPVNVFPASVNRRNYGNMTGTVISVSDYPVTYQYMVDTLGSSALAQQFLSSGAVHEVYVLLIASEETTTGYRWTTSMGPNRNFGDLTLTEASIVLNELRPIQVFFFGY
ncbi:MAG: HlyD family efflux transporter periplasmic adaptor subunit [Defluviitaleaceae bacterium]|nr:HlyD family efflux transporter periplasmic adaptor subunit [Defluviitaleaceae bacterium]